MTKDTEKIIESLSPLELKVIKHLDLPIEEMQKKSGLDQTSFLRAMQFLQNKGIIVLNKEKKKIVSLGTNGIYYKKNHLPERRLLIFITRKKLMYSWKSMLWTCCARTRQLMGLKFSARRKYGARRRS